MGRSRRRFDVGDSPRRSEQSRMTGKTPPSQETDGVSPCCARQIRASGQPSAPAREGEEDTMRLDRLPAVLAGVLFAFLHVVVAQAQTSSTVTGTLTDPSGAALSGAEVIA